MVDSHDLMTLLSAAYEADDGQAAWMLIWEARHMPGSPLSNLYHEYTAYQPLANLEPSPEQAMRPQ
jgi:hypothetical protein